MKTDLTAPLLFEPLFLERMWGGRRLESAFGKKLPPGKRIGESWEVVDRPEAQSVVRLGPWCGQTLHELWRDHRAEIFGDGMPEALRFPIFAKLLDAQEKLSLQVHPDAATAGPLGGEPKTEMWYFAAADDGAEIYAGLRAGVTQDRFEQAVRQGVAADLVHRVGVKTGDAFFVPSGRLHAIGRGNLLVEIQQNSDTTFRLFDWERGVRDGPPRQLQIEEALQSIAFDDFEPDVIRPNGETLVQCPYFTVEKWDLKSARRASERIAFALFVCLSGTVEMNAVHLLPGEFFLVPACAAASELQPAVPATSVLRITLPVR
jgi:mannose-6-phosphate isomerase